jgi:glycerol-3-phosphate dehydrogenase (NAD(P)+)
MRTLVTHMGGHAQTVYGLSGIGDLIATCQSQTSRNWQYGYAIGTHASTDHLHTVEGVRTTERLQAYAQHEQLRLPLLHEIYRVLLESKHPQDALRCLFERPLIHE